MAKRVKVTLLTAMQTEPQVRMQQAVPPMSMLSGTPWALASTRRLLMMREDSVGGVAINHAGLLVDAFPWEKDAGDVAIVEKLASLLIVRAHDATCHVAAAVLSWTILTHDGTIATQLAAGETAAGPVSTLIPYPTTVYKCHVDKANRWLADRRPCKL